jgi:hypothetical protein
MHARPEQQNARTASATEYTETAEQSERADQTKKLFA